MLKTVDSIEFFRLPSIEFRLMTLIKNIGGDDHQLLVGLYIPSTPPPPFGTPAHDSLFTVISHRT